MKKFYSIRLKHHKEFVPVTVAQDMMKAESELVRYLNDNGALEFRYIKSRDRLDLYAEEKCLTMGRIKYPDMFGGRGQMGFMELYISRLISKKIQLAKGSS